MNSRVIDKFNRRNFLKAGSATVAGLTVSRGFAFAQTADISPRRVFPLNQRWLFSEKGAPEAANPTLNDTAWQRVTIPHTNKMLPWHGFVD